MKRSGLAAALAVTVSLPVHAQGGPETACAAGIPAAFAGRCIAAVQAAAAAQPQLGLLVAGGLPGPAAGPGGARLGFLPGLNAFVRANLVRGRLPDIITEANSPPPALPAPLTEERSVTTVALSADVALGVVPGFRVAPGVQAGALDVMASASYLPFDLISRELFNNSSAQFAWGVGVRLGLLQESGAVPGLSLSVARRSLGGVQIGTVCEGEEVADPISTTTPPSTLCREEGDVAQASVSVASWSTRAALSKRVMGVGLGVGAGYDRFTGDLDVAVLGAQGTAINPTRVYRSPGAEMENERWSGFLNASMPLPMGAVSAELGWMQGGERVPGFPEESAFDPGKGTLSLSLGVRLGM